MATWGVMYWTRGGSLDVVFRLTETAKEARNETMRMNGAKRIAHVWKAKGGKRR
jgi:hypothetical protein